MGFRGSGGPPLDSQHPGDSFPQSFSPRSSISTLFDPFLMILDDSRMLRKPLGPSLGFRKPPVEHSGLMTEPVQGQASPGRGKVAFRLGKTPVWNNLSNPSNPAKAVQWTAAQTLPSTRAGGEDDGRQTPSNERLQLIL